MSPSEEPHYHGHRKRLRARFRAAGPEALADYELLELLLFRTLPRQDVKPLAKRLLKEFGSLSGVLGASEERLTAVEGVGESVALDLRLTKAAAEAMTREAVKARPLLSTHQAVVDYARAHMAYADREEFRVLFLDRKNGLIADEVMQVGTVDHTPVYPREVVRRALQLAASAVLLLHNHPSGDPTPSQADIEMTRKIIQVARTMEIAVHDHLIIGRNGCVSLKAKGLM